MRSVPLGPEQALRFPRPKAKGPPVAARLGARPSYPVPFAPGRAIANSATKRRAPKITCLRQVVAFVDAYLYVPRRIQGQGMRS